MQNTDDDEYGHVDYGNTDKDNSRTAANKKATHTKYAPTTRRWFSAG